MTLTIKTQELKEILAKANVGAGYNKDIPKTNLMCIKAKKKSLTIVTTDATNYLYITGKAEKSDDDFYVVIYAEQFIKLIGKLTCDEVTMELDNNILTLKTKNGVYTIEVPLDYDGTPVEYPDPVSNLKKRSNTGTIKSDVIKLIIQTVRPSLATTQERPVLTDYYVADKVVGANGVLITEVNKPIIDIPLLISPSLMDLVGLLVGDIKYSVYDGSKVVFSDKNNVVYGELINDAKDYYTERFNEFLASEFINQVKVDKNELINAIDRISLFVDKLDNRAVTLTFADDTIMVSNVKAKSVEKVTYIEKKAKEDFSCSIHADYLMGQLKAYNGEKVLINYGLDMLIELVGDDTKQMIALMSK